MAIASLNPDLVRVTTEAMNRFALYLTRNGQQELARILVRQAADLELMSPELQSCWGGPFNGQQGRTAIIEQLLIALKPSAIVETGTYRGITTGWFADHFDGPVWSCEKEELYLIQAIHRLGQNSKVHLELADSRDFLQRLVPTLKTDRHNLFYLDAHWERDLPLRDELRIILTHNPEAVIVIDDFRVPGDSGYGWDYYGPDCRVDASQLVEALPPTSSIYFPVLHSSEESGAKRGCCVVSVECGSVLDNCNLLRRWSLSEVLSFSEHEPKGDSQASYLNEILLPSFDSKAVYDSHVVTALRDEFIKLNIESLYRLNDVNVLTAEVELLRREIDRLRAERVLHLQNIETLTIQISTLQVDLTKRLELIEDLDAAVKARDAELSLSREELAKRLEVIEVLDAAVKARDAELSVREDGGVKHQ